MTATNASKPAKDGSGAAFTLEMASESVSKNIALKTYIGSPSTEGLVEPPTHADVTAIRAALGSPMQATGGTVRLAAGTAIIGKAGIDQTTPGTTNAIVVTGTVPLPTGAATAAKQPALGKPGAAASDVISVQGIAGMTALKVDGSGITQPISATTLPLPAGAATAAGLTIINTTLGAPAQDGTDGTGITPPAGGAGIRGWLSGIFNKLNTSISVTGTFWQATQPVSAASLPLPTGASTAAKQPALGTAGAASADVLTVQGVASMTALKVDGSGITQPVSAASLPLPAGAATSALQTTAAAQGSTTSGQTGPLMQGAVTSSSPAYTNAQTNPLSLDTAGNLRVNVVAGGASGNVAQGSTTVGETGVMVQGAVTTAAPSYTTAQTSPLSLNIAGGLRVDGSGVTQPVSGTVTANAGTNMSTSALALETGGNLATIAGLSVAQGSATAGQKGGLELGAVTTGAPAYTTGQTSPLSLTTAGALRTDASATTQPVSAASLPLPAGAATSALQPTAAAQGSTTSGQTGHLILGAVTTAAPVYTTAQTNPLSLDTAGNLRVNVAAGGAAGGTSSSFASAFPATGTAIGAKNGANMVNLAADGSGNLSVVNAAGSAIIGKAGIDQTTPGVTNAITVAPSSAAAVGVAHSQNSTSSTSFVLKNSAGNLYDCYVESSVAGYLMVFDAASVPADGTVKPAHIIPVAAGQLGGVDSGIIPEVYTTGISLAISTTGGFTKTTPGSGTFFFHGRVQ